MVKQRWTGEILHEYAHAAGTSAIDRLVTSNDEILSLAFTDRGPEAGGVN